MRLGKSFERGWNMSFALCSAPSFCLKYKHHVEGGVATVGPQGDKLETKMHLLQMAEQNNTD